MKDVAERAGVSIATVSYVLNDTRKVRPETERRILAAVKELGYAPNIAARNLAVGRSHIVGLVVPDIRNPFFPEVTTAFQEAANLKDMEAIVMNTNYDPQRIRSMVNRLLGLQVPGAAFLTTQLDPNVKTGLADKQICAVYLDHGNVDRYISNIAIDYELGIQLALDHIRALGHTRIGFIGGLSHLSSAQQRKRPFLDGTVQAGQIDVRTVDSDFTVQGGYFACSKLLSGFPATAIICANDLMAIGAMHCAYDRRVRVPDDLSIMGWDNITFTEFTQPALTTVAVPRADIGRIAFEALWSMMYNPDRTGMDYQIKPTLVVRQSTAPAP